MSLIKEPTWLPLLTRLWRTLRSLRPLGSLRPREELLLAWWGCLTLHAEGRPRPRWALAEPGLAAKRHARPELLAGWWRLAWSELLPGLPGLPGELSGWLLLPRLELVFLCLCGFAEQSAQEPARLLAAVFGLL